MIQDILTQMRQFKAWKRENNLYVFTIPSVCEQYGNNKILWSDINPNLTEHIAFILKELQIIPENITENKIYLNPSEYIALSNIFRTLKKRQHQNSSTDKSVLTQKRDTLLEQPCNGLYEWYGRYNTPTEADWNYLKNHLFFKSSDSEKNPFITEQVPQNTHKFVDFIRQNITRSAIAQRIINEFIEQNRQQQIQSKITQVLIQQITKQSAQQPLSSLLTAAQKRLTIDISPAAQLELEKNNFGGCFKKKEYIVQIKRHTVSSKIIAIFLHELRHVTQYLYKLDAFCQFDGITSSCQDFVRNLAIEAEARAYEYLFNIQDHPSENHIYHQHERQVLEQISLSQLPLRDNLSPEDKLLAITRYIQAVTMEKTIQTLCDVYLAKSRLEALKTLNQKGISLSPKQFNALMTSVDNWKKIYFNHYINYLIQDLSYNKQNEKNESTIIEERYLLQAHLKMNLRGCQIFSRPIAENLGIYQSIYGDKGATGQYGNNRQKGKSNKPRYHYTGVSPVLLSQVEELKRKEQYEEIFKIYMTIQSQNPFLPKVQPSFYYSNVNFAYIGYKCYISLQKMGKRESPVDVISALEYDTQDYFNGKDISDTPLNALVTHHGNSRKKLQMPLGPKRER